MTSPRDEALSVRQVAAMTGIATSTLRSWRSRKYGPRSVRLGGRVIYRRSDVEAWVAAQEQATARGGVA